MKKNGKSMSLGELWRSYEARVVPADASQTQRQETRRAFYAAAGVVSSYPPEELFDIHAEAERFIEDVREGKA
jgi:hypothetical protein